MPRRVLWASLLIGSAASLLVCYSIAARTLILGSPEGGWYYGTIRPFSVRPVGAALIAAGACFPLLLVRPPRSRSREWLLVLAWIAAATALHGVIRSLAPYSLERIFVSDAANSFYGVTQHFGPRDVLERFEAVRASSSLHAQSNMPGKVMLLYALMLISSRPEVVAFLLVVVANLGGALMYLFVRDLFDDRRVALFSLVLYLFVPARLFFFPLMNTVTPAVFLACACLLLRWVQTGRPVYASLLGVAVFGLIFFEPLPLVMGILFAALIARGIWLGQLPIRKVLMHIAVGAVSFAGAYAVMRWTFGFDMVDGLRQVSAHAVAFNASSQRPYGLWVRQNPIEFAFGMGMCQAVVFWPVLMDGLRGPGDWRSRLTRAHAVVSVSLLLVLAAVNLLGINRGEVIRLWIFLACFFQIPAAYLCARLPGAAAFMLVVATTLLQASLATAMFGFVIPR